MGMGKNIDSVALYSGMEEFFLQLMRKGIGEKVLLRDIELSGESNGYLLPDYDRFAEIVKEHARKLAWAYRIHVEKETFQDIHEYEPLIEEIAIVAADLAKDIGESLIKNGKLPENLENNEKFKKYVELLSEIYPKASPKKTPAAPKKYPEVKNQKTKSSEISTEAKELLGLLKGLRYARYSKDAVEGAKNELEDKIEALLKNPAENLELLGLYLTLLRFMEREEFERAEELLEKLA